MTSVRGLRVSGQYFDAMGLTPLTGRGLSPVDEVPGQDGVVVLSHQLWQQRFGGRDDAIGQH